MIPREQIEATQRYRKKRRRIILLSLLGIIVLFALYIGLVGFTDVIFRVKKSINSDALPGDWAVFQHDPQRTGASGFAGTLPAGEVAWTFPTGAAIHSSPAVVDGIVYFGSQDGYIYALDAVTGAEIWKFQTGSWVEGSPVIVDGVLYCGSNDGHLYALDAATGEERWAFDTRYPVRGAVAYADGVVYFGSDDWSVHAVDAETGKEKWRHRTDNLVISSPLVVNGVVVIGGMDQFFYGLGASDGRLRLAYPASTLIPGAPVTDGENVYFTGSNGEIFAVDPTAKNWPLENALRRYWMAGYLYGIAPRPPALSGSIWAVYGVTVLDLPGGPFGASIETSTSMTLVDGVFYVGLGNKLLAMDKETRLKVWSFAAGERILSSAAVAGDGVFFGSDDGSVYALDRASGDVLWQYDTGDKVTSSPAVAGSMVYVGSDSGVFYAFK